MADSSPFRESEADESPGFLLWKITALWQQALARILDEFGITQTQYAILASLRWFEAQESPATQAHLGEHARIEKMTLSKAIRRLEQGGFVRRTRSKADARAMHVGFTAKGRSTTEAAIVAIEDADETFFGVLSTADLARFKAIARKLTSRSTAA